MEACLLLIGRIANVWRKSQGDLSTAEKTPANAPAVDGVHGHARLAVTVSMLDMLLVPSGYRATRARVSAREAFRCVYCLSGSRLGCSSGSSCEVFFCVLQNIVFTTAAHSMSGRLAKLAFFRPMARALSYFVHALLGILEAVTPLNEGCWTMNSGRVGVLSGYRFNSEQIGGPLTPCIQEDTRKARGCSAIPFHDVSRVYGCVLLFPRHPQSFFGAGVASARSRGSARRRNHGRGREQRTGE